MARRERGAAYMALISSLDFLYLVVGNKLTEANIEMSNDSNHTFPSESTF